MNKLFASVLCCILTVGQINGKYCHAFLNDYYNYLKDIGNVLDDEKFQHLTGKIDKDKFIFDIADSIDNQIFKIIWFYMLKNEREHDLIYIFNKTNELIIDNKKIENINDIDIFKHIKIQEIVQNFLKTRSFPSDLIDINPIKYADRKYMEKHNKREQEALLCFRLKKINKIEGFDNNEVIYDNFIRMHERYDTAGIYAKPMYENKIKINIEILNKSLIAIDEINIPDISNETEKNMILKLKAYKEIDWTAEININELDNDEAEFINFVRNQKPKIIENGALSTTYIIVILDNIKALLNQVICKKSDIKSVSLDELKKHGSKNAKKLEHDITSIPERRFLIRMFTNIVEDELLIKKMLNYLYIKNKTNNADNVTEASEEDNLQLVDIQINQGDHHSIDSGVAILTFNYKNENIRIVYKTGPLRPDFLLFGETKFYKTMYDSIKGSVVGKKLNNYDIDNSLIEILNINYTTEVEKLFKPFLIVPVEKEKDGNNLKINEIYGYMEFLEGETILDLKLKIRNNLINKIDENKLKTRPALQLGYLARMTDFVSSTDLHHENMLLDTNNNILKAIDFEAIYDLRRTYENKTECSYFENDFFDLFQNNEENIQDACKEYNNGYEHCNDQIKKNEDNIKKLITSTSAKETYHRIVLANTTDFISFIFKYPQIGDITRKELYFAYNQDLFEKSKKLEIPAYYLKADKEVVFDADGKEIEFKPDFIQNLKEIYVKNKLDEKTFEQYMNNYPWKQTSYEYISNNIQKFYDNVNNSDDTKGNKIRILV